MDLIDYDNLDDAVDELNEFIQDELGIKSYREMMLLLERANNTIKPARDKAEQDDQDYIG